MSLAFANIRLGLLAKTVQASRAFERSIPALYLGGSRLYTNATSPTPKEIVVEKVANFEPEDHPYVCLLCRMTGPDLVLQMALADARGSQVSSPPRARADLGCCQRGECRSMQMHEGAVS